MARFQSGASCHSECVALPDANQGPPHASRMAEDRRRPLRGPLTAIPPPIDGKWGPASASALHSRIRIVWRSLRFGVRSRRPEQRSPSRLRSPRPREQICTHYPDGSNSNLIVVADGMGGGELMVVGDRYARVWKLTLSPLFTEQKLRSERASRHSPQSRVVVKWRDGIPPPSPLQTVC